MRVAIIGVIGLALAVAAGVVVAQRPAAEPAMDVGRSGFFPNPRGKIFAE